MTSWWSRSRSCSTRGCAWRARRDWSMATGATLPQIYVRRQALDQLGIWLGLPVLLLASAGVLFWQLEQASAPRLSAYAGGPPPTAVATSILTFENVRHLRKLADF